MSAEHRLNQDLPQFCEVIMEEVQALSALLKLKIGVDHDAIFDACRHDVELLDNRMRSIQAMGKYLIAYNSFENPLSSNEQWQKIEQQIPTDDLFLNLTAEKAALPANELLQNLQESFRQGVGNLMRIMCFYIDLLVSEEYIGIVKFTSTRAGKYFYYRHDAVKEEVSKVRKALRFFDDVKQLELHEHHIVRATQSTIADYDARVPPRVRRFLDNIPSWIRPHMKIISGEVTLQSITKRVAEQGFETRTIAIWKGYPTLTLGHYIFVRWRDENHRRKEGAGYLRLQLVKDSVRARNTLVAAKGILIMATFAFCASLAWCVLTQ